MSYIKNIAIVVVLTISGLIFTFKQYRNYWHNKTIFSCDYTEEAFNKISLGKPVAEVIILIGNPLEVMVLRNGQIIHELEGKDYVPQDQDEWTVLRYSLGKEDKYNRVVRDVYLVNNVVSSTQAEIVSD